MLSWILARAKLVAVATAAGAAYTLLEAVDYQLQQSMGFAIPAEVKAVISVKIGLIAANFTDNVKLLPDGFAIPAATMPVKSDTPAA